MSLAEGVRNAEISLSVLRTRAGMPNLPEEIMLDILSRLPVGSLCRFRCVSKPWRCLISHPDFIRAHLTYNNKREHVVLHDYYDHVDSIHFKSFQFGDESVQPRLKLPNVPQINYNMIFGLYDGLLLIPLRWSGHECFAFYLLNPFTREFREVPPTPFQAGQAPFNFYGFGYDSRRDDYKVVCVSHYMKSADGVVSVYALRTKTWKKIDNSPYDCCSMWLGHQPGVIVNGALHWRAETPTSAVIVAFDLVHEKFCTVPSLYCMNSELAVLGGCLCASGKWYINDTRADFWVMKEYGVSDSWTKFTVAFGSFCRSLKPLKPLSLRRTGQVLFLVDDDKLALFDLQEEKFKELVVHGLPSDFEAVTAVESLVSPNREC